MNLFNDIKKGAMISDCKRYRFRLWRIWDESLPLVMFVMHNPSKADDQDNDPTITRCIGFAKSWGYGGIYVGNLITYRATKPDTLKGIPFDVLCPLVNIGHTNEMAALCKMHVLAYGNPVVKDCIPELFDDRWHYLKLTKTGNPMHPLYLKSSLLPIPMNIKPCNQ